MAFTSQFLHLLAELHGKRYSVCGLIRTDKQMLPLFDIFRVDADGTNCCACVKTLDGAKVRVQEFMETWPAEYLVFNRVTGRKISIERDTPPKSKL